MTLVSIRRNEVRSALLDLHYGVISVLADSSKETRVKEFESAVKKICIDVKLKYRGSRLKNTIRKVLNEQVRYLGAMAREVAQSGRFQNGKLLYDIYDGIPLFQFQIARTT